MAQTAASNGKSATTERDIDALSEQIATLRGDISSLAELVGEIGTRRGKAAKSRVEAQAEELRGKGEDALRDAGRRAAEFEHDAADRIRTTPFQAVGLAAAAGFLLGYLGARR
ncbi:DUF883 family protein [Salipiger abyssi]|uniref:DUF883 domain-containing protein n=1 Tax=Salipiger abyssi TaxID=1250539 RepID=A0A1P8UWS2_9RHOB|nr:DUF883 family protein [Salipiger abyssi]APZ53835.1 hypothetical protein Ga0080574_TMP3501 [Salipiger abyssi]